MFTHQDAWVEEGLSEHEGLVINSMLLRNSLQLCTCLVTSPFQVACIASNYVALLKRSCCWVILLELTLYILGCLSTQFGISHNTQRWSMHETELPGKSPHKHRIAQPISEVLKSPDPHQVGKDSKEKYQYYDKIINYKKLPYCKCDDYWVSELKK